MSEYVKNLEVTLEEEGHGYPEEAKETAFMAWDCVADVQRDDGRQYWIVILPVTTMGERDAWAMSVSWVKGKVSQYPNTAYNIADFLPGLMSGWYVYPDGTHKVKKSKDKIEFDLGDCHLICKDDKTWHFNVEDKEQGIKLEMVHHGSGYPCWYGKEKSRTFAPHIVVYGYYWSGRIDGTLTIGEHKVRIKGSGVRERVYGVSACPAEGGGWHDWIWFHFDELFGCVDEMKYSKFKLMSLYLNDEKYYTQDGNFNIEHYNWAYLRPPMGVFIPTRYKLTVEVEAGVLEMTADVVAYHVWSYTGDVPDAPTANLYFDSDTVFGTFTYKDGRKRTLTNGRAGTLIRVWKPYPNFIPQLTGTELPIKPLLPII